MTTFRKAIERYHLRRPTLRMQLALLYAGLFAVLCLGVLGAAGLLIQSSSQQAGPVLGPFGATPSAANGRGFDVAAALIALVAALVALGLGWWFAGRFLRPLRVINTTAKEISSSNLSRRLNLSGPDDEITELAGTLDGLLGRLDASFESQRNFVANASHELRTPLAGQRTLLQVAVADPEASVASLRGACEEALALGEQQERLIDALLTLASSERGLGERGGFDLATIAEDVVATRRSAADGAGVAVVTSFMPAAAVGDARLVERLVANLVDNALRYNVARGRVDVMTRVHDGRATLTVSNTGPVVPVEDADRLFRPFERLGSERAATAAGPEGRAYGLGLAIVRAVAEAHGADLVATPRPDGGLEVVVAFPRPG